MCIELDAQKCYDRMYPNVGKIALTCIGLPRTMCVAITRTVSKTMHNVNTSIGPSNISITCQQTNVGEAMDKAIRSLDPHVLPYNTR